VYNQGVNNTTPFSGDRKMAYMSEGLAGALAMATKEFSDSVTSMQEYAGQLEKFVGLVDGIEIEQDQWKIRYRSDIRVKREDLPKLRKALGRLQAVGKSVPYDYESTGEVVVRVKPMAQEFSKLRFEYRTKFRKGGKCRIVKQENSYTTIVCDV
jgi:hypothetical protein